MPVFTIEELQAAVDNGTLGAFIIDNDDTFQQNLRGLLSLYRQTTIDKNTAKQAQQTAEQAQQSTEADALRDANEYHRQTAQLNNRIATLNTEIQRLQHLQAAPAPSSNTQIEELRNQIEQLRTHQNAPATSIRSSPHPDPAKFGGTRRSAIELRSYIIDLKVKLRANADWFPTELGQMTYVLSTLEGEARKHIDPHLNDAGEFTTLESVEGMLDILRNTFGNKFSREEAFANLQQEKQGHRPVSEFLSSYLSLATAANSTGFDCTQRLVLAVHPSIRDRILSDPRYTSAIEINALADLIREKDNINRAVYGAQYLKSNLSSFTATPIIPAPTASLPDPDAMNLDALKVGGKYVWTWKDVEDKTWAKTPELKAARKKFQIEHNLCHYCDDKTHSLQGCDKLKEARRRKEEREKGKDKNKDEGKA